MGDVLEENFHPEGCIYGVLQIILPKCKDIRNSYTSPDWNDMRSIADMNELSEIEIEKRN